MQVRVFLLIYDVLVPGYGQVDPHGVRPAMAVVLARSLDDDVAADDPAVELLQLRRLVPDDRLDRVGEVEVLRSDGERKIHSVLLGTMTALQGGIRLGAGR